MSRKTEALEILARDEIIGSDAIRLNILTARQAGYRCVEYSDGSFGLERPDGSEVQSWQRADSAKEAWSNTPDYVISVDKCLGLPLPRYHYWQLFSRTESVEVDWYSAEICHAMESPADDNKTASTLPLAMIRAWWSIQPEQTS